MIIVAGAAQLVTRPRPWLGASVVIAVGTVLLLTRLDVLPEASGALIWPSGLIVVGVWLLVSRRGIAQASGASDDISVIAFFGEQSAASSSAAFSRASVNAFFGGASLDLTGATPVADGAEIAAAGVFGGAEIIVPRGWDVRVSGLPIFGGIGDKTEHDAVAARAPRLIVKGLALFGGVEVKHGERRGGSLLQPQAGMTRGEA